VADVDICRYLDLFEVRNESEKGIKNEKSNANKIRISRIGTKGEEFIGNIQRSTSTKEQSEFGGQGGSRLVKREKFFLRSLGWEPKTGQNRMIKIIHREIGSAEGGMRINADFLSPAPVFRIASKKSLWLAFRHFQQEQNYEYR